MECRVSDERLHRIKLREYKRNARKKQAELRTRIRAAKLELEKLRAEYRVVSGDVAKLSSVIEAWGRVTTDYAPMGDPDPVPDQCSATELFGEISDAE